jgi:hypothetical protein
MPLLTRIFIKTAFVYLVLALVLGIWLAAGAVNGLFPVYIHMLVLGWLTQLIFGVVFWMFPKFQRRSRAAVKRLAGGYILLNLGLLLRAIGEPINSNRPNSFSGWMLVLSAILQFLAGLMFVVNSWERVKEK